MAKIHITSRFKDLVSILEEKALRLHYCKETFNLGSNPVSSAVHPMVSFSAYLFKNLKYKMITYGKYGIAFKDAWIKKHRIHQVIYLDRDGMLADSLATLLKFRRIRDESKLPDEVRSAVMLMKCFTKNSTGYNPALNIEDFAFHKENEWRYIPRKQDIGNGLLSQSKSVYKKKHKEYDQKLLKYPLRFNANDVSRVFVSNDREKQELSTRSLVDTKKIFIRPWKVPAGI
jgi:hypothetical protein